MICLPNVKPFSCAYIRKLLKMPSNTSKLFVVNFYPKNLGRTCCWSSLHFCTFDSQQGKAKKLRIRGGFKFSLRSDHDTGTSQVKTDFSGQVLCNEKIALNHACSWIQRGAIFCSCFFFCNFVFFSFEGFSKWQGLNQILVSICVFMHVVHLESLLWSFCLHVIDSPSYSAIYSLALQILLQLCCKYCYNNQRQTICQQIKAATFWSS